MTNITVKLNQLRLSPLNVRKVKPQQIDQLAADIAAHGILQNLIVYLEDDKYWIAAGGRRYRALKLLQKAKLLGGTYEVPVDVRDKSEAVELSLAENAQREAMHPADAVRAYGDMLTDDNEPEDIAARFGVSPTYVKRVLRLAALHKDVLDAFAKDEIGMETAQALTLTDDTDRQKEVMEHFGNSAHQIRRFLTEEKIGSDHRYFIFVGYDDYIAAGGTMTADLFAEKGEGYANDPELVQKLALEKLEKLGGDMRNEGWHQVKVMAEKPDDFYALRIEREEGTREATSEELGDVAALENKRTARIAEIGDDDQWHDDVLRSIDRRVVKLEAGLRYYTDAQKAEGYAMITIGHDGSAVMNAIRTKKPHTAPTGVDSNPLETPDYSRPMLVMLSKVRTLAVQEAVAQDPALALDILLDSLIGQIVHDEPAYYSPLAIRPEAVNPDVPEEYMTVSDIGPYDTLAASVISALPNDGRLTALRKMDAADKSMLLASLVAHQLDGIQRGASEADTRTLRFDVIAAETGINMAAKWEAPIAFFEKLRKPVMIKILAENISKDAADNCATMKKAALAHETAQRMSGRG